MDLEGENMTKCGQPILVNFSNKPLKRPTKSILVDLRLEFTVFQLNKLEPQ